VGGLDGRVALVTGASRGIGAAIAKRFASEGAAVAMVARTLDPSVESWYPGTLADTVGFITDAGGTAVAIQADLTDPTSRPMIVERTVAELGPVDILVNNAAASWAKTTADMPAKLYRKMFEVHVFSALELAQLVLPTMRQRGEGWILNITSSEAAHPVGPPYVDLLDQDGLTLYGMCKVALERFSTGLAAELYDERVAVNALGPTGPVLTYGMHHPPTEGREDTIEPIEHMAEAALALCSGPPSVLTGRIAFTRPLLDELGRTPRGLDGRPLPAT